ncbi:hypothetical protein KI387_005468, partial [Taxus chinensis]
MCWGTMANGRGRSRVLWSYLGKDWLMLLGMLNEGQLLWRVGNPDLNGMQVAVKSLSAQSKQGVQEFLTEIAIIIDVKHENLVKLHGCCVQGSHRILVYEYLENNSIAQALLGSENSRIDLDWPTRAKICTGTASGLAYLHEELVPYIVHRDIKASNVLLDRDLNPKIADFGLAKLFPDNVTHISTRVAGTIGYLAPEYALRGQLTKKADIYSFGILVLEMISGRSNTKYSLSDENALLLEWTWHRWQENKLLDVIDPKLKEYPTEEVLRFAKVALLCTQAAANFRPSMSQVVAMLTKEININENLLTRPGLISDYRNFKAGVGTHGFGSGIKMQPTQKGVSSSSSSSMTTIVSTSPATFTEMEP